MEVPRLHIYKPPTLETVEGKLPLEGLLYNGEGGWNL